LSYGDGKGCRTRRPKSPVRLAGSVPVASRPKERSFLLLVKPAKELLEPRIGLDLLDRVERVAQFVMRPRFVDNPHTNGRSERCPAHLCSVALRDALAWAPLGCRMRKLHPYRPSDIAPVRYPFVSLVKSFRTPGWSLPPTHPRAFELKHDSTTSESRSIGACNQCPVRCKQRGARASSRSGVQKWCARPVTLRTDGTHLVRLRL